MPFKAHLFICTNKKADGSSCAPKNAEQLRANVKARCKDASTGIKKGTFRINGAGCLDQCERGIAAVLYPSGQWFHDLTASTESEDLLIEAVKKQIQ